MTTPRTIYRVYQPYHYSDESGTNEYGCYSTREKAKARLEIVWTTAGYPEPKPENKTDTGWYASSGWDSYVIRIGEIVIDQDREEADVGHT